MKKTLIALMALAGIACGADSITLDINSFNSSIQEIAADYSPTSYTLEFTIDSLTYNGTRFSGFVLRLADNWGIFTQSNQHIGLDNTDAGDRTWVTATETEGSTKTWTYTDSTKLDSWLVNAALDGTSVELDVTSEGSSITLTNNSGTFIIETGYSVALSDVVLVTEDKMKDYGSANGVDVNNFKGVASISNATLTYTATTNNAVPEPATATLSLLALAGLAARRRRR